MVARCASRSAPAKSSMLEPRDGERTMARLRDIYNTTIRPELMTQFGYANLFEVPRLEKVVINMGVGEAVQDSKRINAAVEELTRISGQKPVVTDRKSTRLNYSH